MSAIEMNKSDLQYKRTVTCATTT